MANYILEQLTSKLPNIAKFLTNQYYKKEVIKAKNSFCNEILKEKYEKGFHIDKKNDIVICWSCEQDVVILDIFKCSNRLSSNFSFSFVKRAFKALPEFKSIYGDFIRIKHNVNQAEIYVLKGNINFYFLQKSIKKLEESIIRDKKVPKVAYKNYRKIFK